MKRKRLNKGKKVKKPSQFQPRVNAINDIEKLQETMENCRQEKKNNKGMEIPKVDVCDICGDRGFSIALLCCSQCSDTSVHQYCLGIAPGSIDDTFDWICEYCSPSMEFEIRNIPGSSSMRVDECCKEPAMAYEMESQQYVDEIFPFVEPLCILPPLSQHGSSEQKETSNSSKSGEEHDSPMSSFMENPEVIMRGLVLLASTSGEVIIHRGMNICDSLNHQITEDTVRTGSLCLDHSFKDGEESQAHVSFPCESLEETVSKVAQLASPSGEITKFCPGLGTSIVNMNSSCNEVNSDKLVNNLDHVMQENPKLGDPSLKMDGKIDSGHLYEEPGFNNCVVGACQEDTSAGADVRDVFLIGLPAVGTKYFNWTTRKRGAALMKCNLIPPLGHECKRARSKRCRISRPLSMGVGACNPTVLGAPARGEDRSDQFINGPKVTLRKTLTGMSQADTSMDEPLLMRGLCVNTVSQECCQFNGMADTFGSNVRKRAAETDDRLRDDQEMGVAPLELGLHAQRLSLCNAPSIRDLALLACDQPRKRGLSFLGRTSASETLMSTKLASSQSSEQARVGIHNSQGDERSVFMLTCMEGETQGLEQIMDVEMGVPNKNALHPREVSNTTGLGLSHVTLERQPLSCRVDLTSAIESFARNEVLLDWYAPMEMPRDEMNETFNMIEKVKKTYPNAWKELDFIIQKVKSSLEDEKKKIKEVVKKNRRTMWKVVYEFEKVKMELEKKKNELSMKTMEAQRKDK